MSNKEEKKLTIFEKYENISNSKLLADYTQAEICGEHCMRIHLRDVYAHFHTARELREVILSRMVSPSVIKLIVK